MAHEETVYEALDHAHGGEGQWAFGTGFDDPLAGVDTTVPDGSTRPTSASTASCSATTRWCSRSG